MIMKKVIVIMLVLVGGFTLLTGCSTQIGSQVKDKAEEAKETIADAKDTVVDELAAFREKSDSILAETERKVMDAFTGAKTTLTDDVESAKIFLESEKQKIDDTLSNLEEDVKKIKDDAVGSVQEEYLNLIAQAKAENQNLADAIEEGAAEKYEASKAALENLLDKIKNFGK